MIASESEARAFCVARCNDDAMRRLEKFTELLRDENTRQNLVSRASLEAVWQRHIADSLQLFDHAPDKFLSWLDLGTGAGMPGLVLAIARPEWRVGLVESRRKRIDWLQRVAHTFGLANCAIHGDRLENVESRDIDVISARAFAPLPKLLSLSARFSTPDTTWLLPKGRSGAQELQEQPKAIRAMFHVEQSATDAEAGILVGRGRPTKL